MRDLGYGERDLIRIHDAYELAESIADGLYRPHGQPFISHLVRTASIVLAERLPVDAVVAALLHFAYGLDKFADNRRLHVREEHREEVRTIVGEDAERLIWDYVATPWVGYVEEHQQALNGYSDAAKLVLTIRLANDLEDHLDLAALFHRHAGPHRREGKEEAALARALGRDRLAEELEEAYRAETETAVPGALVRSHTLTYERPERHHWAR